jgi:ABC-type amino acid transport substrate-binding protein
LLVLFAVLLQVSVAPAAVGRSINLNESERAWLEAHPVIRIAPDPDFAPYEWFNNAGDYQGITSDYIRLLEKKLGVQFVIVTAPTWSAVIEMAKQRQVDVLPAVTRTPQRDAYLIYSDPYIFMQGVLIANERLASINSLDGLVPYKVAVVEGYVWDDILTPRETEIAINRFTDLQTALVSTSRSVTDVTVTFQDAALYMINKEGLVDLIVSATLPQLTEIGFGVRNDWLPLVSILNKALASINADERNAIREKWIGQVTPAIWQDPVYRTAVLATLGILLLSVIIVASWNRMLNARVLVRTEELKNAQSQLLQAEKMESVGRLAAGIAHEVKNPLAIIQMGSYLLSQEIPADDTLTEVLNDIDDAVKRADSVIMGLLDFFKGKNETANSSTSAVLYGFCVT